MVYKNYQEYIQPLVEFLNGTSIKSLSKQNKISPVTQEKQIKEALALVKGIAGEFNIKSLEKLELIPVSLLSVKKNNDLFLQAIILIFDSKHSIVLQFHNINYHL